MTPFRAPCDNAARHGQNYPVRFPRYDRRVALGNARVRAGMVHHQMSALVRFVFVFAVWLAVDVFASIMRGEW